VIWLGIGAILLLLIGICLIAGYIVIRQFRARTEPALPLVMPTSPVTTPTISAPSVATPLLLAPTATLSQPAPVPSPPLGQGNVEARLLSAPPVIDGDLTEWEGFTSYTSAFRVHSATSWDGSDDVTAVWRLGWDAEHLYIGVAVSDDIHVQTQTGNQIFRGDSLDMQFDTDRAGDYGNGLSPDDYQIILSPGSVNGLLASTFRFQGTLDGRILDAAGGSHVTVAAARSGEGYALEAAIPWSDLGIVPAAGLVIGLALNVNDNDGPGTAVQEVMKSHVPTRTLTDPTTWGTLTLN